MPTSSFPSVVTGVTVQVASDVALSGDGSALNKLSLAVDDATIEVNGSNQLAIKALDPDSTPELAGLGIGTAGVSGQIKGDGTSVLTGFSAIEISDVIYTNSISILAGADLLIDAGFHDLVVTATNATFSATVGAATFASDNWSSNGDMTFTRDVDGTPTVMSFDGNGLTVAGTGIFSGSVTATSYTGTTIPASDAGLMAGQFYHTVGVLMVKL